MLDGELRKELAEISAKLMALTAQTAPKSKGEDSVEIIVVSGDEKDRIAEKMIEMADEREKNYIRDGESVKKADAVILIGAYGDRPLGLNCGACGFENCGEFRNAERKEGRDFLGPNCVYRLIDLGIAIGSAAKLSSLLGADTRVMFRLGTAARKLGIARSDVVMGIPVAVTSKNPFFDR